MTDRELLELAAKVAGCYSKLDFACNCRAAYNPFTETGRINGQTIGVYPE